MLSSKRRTDVREPFRTEGRRANLWLSLFIMDALSEYTLAVIKYQKGDIKEAARHLSTSLGADDVLAPVATSIDLLLKPGSPAMPVLLKLLNANQEKNGLRRT